ncbi:SMP-30/gluconolactonase/LRE family protein [Pseudobacteriovorax antillogorgiicola]|uniref:SMP-30/Gluconolaconase/LRE-like region-containing protein n=1 Tax=Pseudobacteriovorax antillogorgiicola TaxID=1513793 RepID=A0A1Y6BSF0_9BACT|nr:SMP-30/gluconolactonase/LRE family protein [Pseudobacteriovorax antillogorgiicola]TCS53099.1 SMP-30/gluconolaconase/LRE-like protein [Pseudobacteriovorax antillogorgiicola]SMF25876.1 SMP-30/Gluconolaconase/LRE-like region-containing protein [Pseudobacteriovorax antillogorgiicola]
MNHAVTRPAILALSLGVAGQIYGKESVWQAASGGTKLTCASTSSYQSASSREIRLENNGRRLNVAFRPNCVLELRRQKGKFVLDTKSSAECLSPDSAPQSWSFQSGTAEFTGRGPSKSLKLTLQYQVGSESESCQANYQAWLSKSVASPEIEELASFSKGDFIESVAVDRHGDVWVMNLGPTGTGVFRIAEKGGAELVVPYPEGQGGNIAFTPQGELFGTISDVNDPEGIRAIIKLADGAYQVVADLPKDSIPNGIASDHLGNLYVADSGVGRIFKWNRKTGVAKVWAEGGSLVNQGYLGPNGIKVANDSVFISNSSTAAIVETKIKKDGTAGKRRTIVSNGNFGIGADDFAVDRSGNLWVTTHPSNTLVKLQKNGRASLILDSQDGLWGPTSAFFDPRPGMETILYIVGDGNLLGSQQPDEAGSSELFPSKVLRINTADFGKL